MSRSAIDNAARSDVETALALVAALPAGTAGALG